MHIVVKNQDVHRAVAEITRSLPYRVFTGVHNHFNNPILVDPDRTRAYPNSTFLETVLADNSHPYMIIVHPESEFNLVVGDYSRSVPLPPFPDSIRFPTRTAFLDSAIETRLDPNSGLVAKRATEALNTWISYVLTYTLRNRPIVLPNGNLDPESEALKRSLKPENQSQIDAYLRMAPGASDRARHMKLRREILGSTGQIELADRPPSRLPPGNADFLIDPEKKAQAISALQQARLERSTIPPRVATPSSSQK